MVQFLFKLETENSCCVPQFPFIASCYKIVDSHFHSRYVKESEPESENVGRSESVSDIFPPTPKP